MLTRRPSMVWITILVALGAGANTQAQNWSQFPGPAMNAVVPADLYSITQ